MELVKKEVRAEEEAAVKVKIEILGVLWVNHEKKEAGVVEVEVVVKLEKMEVGAVELLM